MKAWKLAAVIATVCSWSCAPSDSGNPSATAPSAVPASAAAVAGQGGSGSDGVMQFGQEDVGSPAPPGSTHDQSAHAKDNMVPRTVVIKAGGTVTFNIPANVHQIGIYAPGTSPEDIDTSIVTTLAASAGCAGNPVVNAPLVIDDSTNRVASIPVPCFAPAQKQYTFSTPGKYLVICTFLPHFEVGMYGWVDVK